MQHDVEDIGAGEDDCKVRIAAVLLFPGVVRILGLTRRNMSGRYRWRGGCRD